VRCPHNDEVASSARSGPADAAGSAPAPTPKAAAKRRRKVEAGAAAAPVPVPGLPAGEPPSAVPPPPPPPGAGCPPAGCPWTGSYGDLVSRHLPCCEYEPVACPRGCRTQRLRRNALAAHLASDCPCPLPCDICGAVLTASQLAAHATDAAQAHVQLLQRRLRELGAGRCEFRPQPALGDRWASGGVFAVWQLDRAALCRMARGRCLRSRTTAFDNAEWSSGHVRCRLKVFPFGLDFGTARSAAADDESPFTVVAEFGCGDFRVDARVCLSSSAEAEAETRHVDLTRPRVVHRTVSWSLPGVVLSALPTGAAEPLELRFAITAGRLVMKTSERSDNDNDYAADSVSSDTGDYTD